MKEKRNEKVWYVCGGKKKKKKKGEEENIQQEHREREEKNEKDRYFGSYENIYIYIYILKNKIMK